MIDGKHLDDFLFNGNIEGNCLLPSVIVRAVDWSLKVSAPHSRNFLNVLMTIDLLLLPKQHFSNRTIWCFEMKLWLKVNFCQCVQWCAETTMFLAIKSLFVQSRPILTGQLWTTLVVFIWQKCMCNEAVIFASGKERL